MIKLENKNNAKQKFEADIKRRLIKKKYSNHLKNAITDIITAHPNDLAPLATTLQSLDNSHKAIEKKFSRTYTYFSKKNGNSNLPDYYDAYALTKDLDIKVCPYCGINYTYTVIHKGNKIIRAELDHFFDKEKNPFFSVSFYNLIPSCTSCNCRVKHTTSFALDTHIHPYLEDFDIIMVFELDIHNPALTKIDDFSLSLRGRKYRPFSTEEQYKITRAENNIKDLKLTERYQEHKDTALEIINKARIYTPEYLEELRKNMGKIIGKADMSLIYETFVGISMNRENILKTPLLKLKRDIWEMRKK